MPNTLIAGAKTILPNRTELTGNINVMQDAPSSGAGTIDVFNGIPAGNVLIPRDAIDFGQPPPTLS